MYGLGTEDQLTSQKTTICRAFNNHFFEFMDDIIGIYPENEVLRSARNSFEMVKKANPTSIVKVWYNFVYSPYQDKLAKGNLEFFLDKDYSADLQKGTVKNVDSILSKIDSIREPISQMSDTNREHCQKYIMNLCKLSVAYAPYI